MNVISRVFAVATLGTLSAYAGSFLGGTSWVDTMETTPCGQDFRAAMPNRSNDPMIANATNLRDLWQKDKEWAAQYPCGLEIRKGILLSTFGQAGFGLIGIAAGLMLTRRKKETSSSENRTPPI